MIFDVYQAAANSRSPYEEAKGIMDVVNSARQSSQAQQDRKRKLEQEQMQRQQNQEFKQALATIDPNDQAQVQQLMQQYPSQVATLKSINEFGVDRTTAPQYSNVQYDQQGNPYGLNPQTGQFEAIGGGFVRGNKGPETVVNVGGGDAYHKEEAKLNAQAFRDINKSAKDVRSEAAKIDRLLKLSDKAFSGTGADMKLFLAKMGKAAGIDTEGLNESEVFRTVSNELVLDKAQQMIGALSEGDRQFLVDTVPSLNNTAEGRKAMLTYAKKVSDRQIEYARQAREFRKKNGYFNQGEFESQFQQWADNNPLFENQKAPQQKRRPVKAPSSALDFLQANPKYIDQFEAKYGYRPEGF